MTRKMWRKSIPCGGNNDEMFQRDRKKATEVSAQCTSQRPVRDELGELERARY